MGNWALPLPGNVSSFVLLVAAALVLAGCGGGTAPSTSPTPSASTTASASPSPTPFVHAGAAITAEEATTSLPVLRDKDHYWSPIGGFGHQVVVAAQPRKGPDFDAAPYEYSLWDPATGAITPEWTGEVGKPENIYGSDGDWLLTVERGGYGETIGMDDWSIYLRDMKTGEEIEVAKSERDQATSSLNLTAVTIHDTPTPSISNGKVVWSEAAFAEGGTITSRIKLYDIATQATSTLAETSDHKRQDIWSATIGGTWVTWLYNDGNKVQIVAHDLSSGIEQRNDITGDPYSATITQAGGFVAWDEKYFDKHILDLVFREDQLIAKNQGWGTNVSGRYVSWDPGTISGGQNPAGFYDFLTHDLRLLTPTRDALTNIGHIMGGWFIWQHLPLIGSEYSDEQGKWYAIRLPD